MSQAVLDPLEALHRLTSRFRSTRRERTPVERALGRYLASPLSVPLPRRRPGGARAALNGYALPAGCGSGEFQFPLAQERSTPVGYPASPSQRTVLLRVDTGEPVPPGTERVVPVEWTVIVASPDGSPRVRIPEDALPPPGYGLVESEAPLLLEAGTRIDARLLSLLLARGISEVETSSLERIGILTIGGELTDVLGDPDGPASKRDVTGFWLPAMVRALGLLPEPLGIVADDLAEGREALLRAQKRKLRAVLAAGGIGDGLGDRALELLSWMGARIDFERVAIRPGRRLVLGEWMELKLLLLSGRPLDAAVGFDLFGGPALLAAAGAPPHRWDWSRRLLPPALVSSLERPEEQSGWAAREGRDGPTGRPLWSAVPLKAVAGGWTALGPARSLSPSLPWIPEHRGWAIVPPPESPAPDRIYFQPPAGECEEYPAAGFPQDQPAGAAEPRSHLDSEWGNG